MTLHIRSYCYHIQRGRCIKQTILILALIPMINSASLTDSSQILTRYKRQADVESAWRSSAGSSTNSTPDLLDYENRAQVANLESSRDTVDVDIPEDAYIVSFSEWILADNAASTTSTGHRLRHSGRRAAARRNDRIDDDFITQQARMNGGPLSVLAQRERFNMSVDNRAHFENISVSQLMEIIVIMNSDCTRQPERIIKWVSGNRGILFECENGAWVLTYLKRHESRVRAVSVRDCHEIHQDGEEFLISDKEYQVEISFTNNKKQRFRTLCREDDPDAHQALSNAIRGRSNRQNEAWTVIQTRTNGATNFYRSLKRYKRGFGRPSSGEYWLGLEALHLMTHLRRYELRLEVTTNDNTKYVSNYANFKIFNEERGYKLKLGRFLPPSSGDTTPSAGDVLSLHDNGLFQTKDSNVDATQNCARLYGTAFWFRGCWAAINLNGPYHTQTRNNKGVRWATADPNEVRRVKKTLIMIRPIF